jgi:predicted HTH transcriptional regulator
VPLHGAGAIHHRLTQLARSIVTPALHVEVQQYDTDGKTVLVLTVQRGANPPYGITLPGKKDKPIEFYDRRD